MSNVFKIYDADANEQTFTHEEATEDDTFLARYLIEMAEEKTAGGQMKQQIRPGARFAKSYIMKLDEGDYITFIRLITNNADDYYIEFTTAPTLLTEDTDADMTNNFKVVFGKDDIDMTYGNNKIYSFRLNLFSANLL